MVSTSGMIGEKKKENSMTAGINQTKARTADNTSASSRAPPMATRREGLRRFHVSETTPQTGALTKLSKGGRPAKKPI